MMGDVRRLKSERSTEVPFASQNCARRSDRDPEMTRDHLRLSSFSGTRRAQKHQSSFHLVPVEEDRHAADDQDGDADVKPHERRAPRSLSARVAGAVEAPAPNASLAQESVVMPLNKMCLHLAHGI